MLSASDPWWINLFEPLGAHWVHRWLAFVVAGIAVATAMQIRRAHRADRVMQTAAASLLAAVAIQIALGVSVVVLGVPKWIALAHQGVGVLIFAIALVLVYMTASSPDTARLRALAEAGSDREGRVRVDG